MKSISTLFRQLSLIVVLISAFSLSALSAVYEKVTTAPSDWSGQYLIVYETGKVAFDGSRTTLDAVSNTVSVNIADNKIEATEAMKAAQFTINANGHIKSASGYYIGQTSNANGLKSDASTTYKNTLSLNADGTVNIVSGGAYLRYNATSGQTRFRYYKSSSYTGQKAICLYKLVEEQGGDDEPETPCTDPTISFAENTITKTKGEVPFKNELINKEGSTGDVTYATENENIATVNATTGYVTIVGVGTTNIIATVAADGTYCEATAEYTLTVEGRSFDIKWMNGTETYEKTTYTEGETLTLPETDPTSCSDNYSTFVGWYTQQAGPTSAPSTELQGTEASKTDITGPTTFYAVFGEANSAPIPTESSIDFSAQNYTNQQEISSVSIAEGIIVNFNKGTNPNTPKYYTSGSAIRVYGGGYFTVTSETTISSITLTFGSSDGSNEITTDGGTYLNGTWTGSAKSVTFTVGGSSGNRRIQGITIEFESSASSTYISTCDKEDIPAIYTTYDAIDFEPIVEKENSTKTITITTVNLKKSASVSISGANASDFAVNPTSIEDNSETEITITFTAPDVDVETECTATLTITSGEQTKEIALTATVKPLLTLTANINGNPENVGTFAEGDDITTALNAIDVTTPEGWSFAGWVAKAIDGSQTTTPEYLTTMPAEATIAYAVFKLGKEQIFTETLSASTANYTDISGYCEFTATSTSGTWSGKANYVKDKEYIQINSDKGYILSTNFAGNVNSIKITTTNTTRTDITFYINSNSITGIPTSGDLGSHKTTTVDEEFTINLTSEAKQFYIYSSGAVYISKIEVTYGTASNVSYRTSVSSLIVTNNDIETISENVNSLTLHVDKTPNTQLKVTETITADKVTIIQTIDASRWFFFSLPFDCDVADIVATYENGGAELEYAPDESTGDYVIAEYDGTNSWVELLGDNNPTLKANQGYIIGHFESGDVTVKFPSNGAQNISAPANATLAKTSDNGFNLIGLPYYQKVNASLNNVNHLSIPNEDGETYNQTDDLSLLANIAPFTSFFVQTEAENIEFTLGAQQNAAPRLDGRSNRASLHKAVVTLTDTNGGADKTTIINNPSKTTDYEIGHDLTKLIGYAEIPQIYSLQGDEMLAFNSLAIDNSTVIPLGVYAHADGDYTFSLSEKSVGDLEGWELYDNETGKTTRLANEDLTVNLAQGTHEDRFEIRLQQRISTDCDNAMGDMTTWTANGTLNINNLPADAVVYIYDAVGRMVYVANNNSTTFNYTFAARGVYNIVVRTAENSVSFKTIY